jgi:steroid 5-alpha reductase family enzyme
MGATSSRRDVLVLAETSRGQYPAGVGNRTRGTQSGPSLRLQDIVATAVLIAALFGEALADWQLRSFKHMHSAHTSVCDHGLWRYSRHPNYFFEWMVWLAYPIFAIDFAGYNTFGWIGLSAPIVMYWLLVHISGVPPLEEHMHQSRGAAFRDYRRRTSVFFPWRPRSERRT